MSDIESPAAKSTRRRTSKVEDVDLPDAELDAQARASVNPGDTVDVRDATGRTVVTIPDPKAEVQAFIWQRLTRPFEPEHIEKLPKTLRAKDEDKGMCTNSRYSADGHFCGKYHARAVHLDYVGHAGITTRLNDVLGPEGWDFEPYTHNADGIPLMGREFYAKLTILGVTKWDLAANYNSLQEAYGDALRRCAMRFGIGTYLWSKSEAAANLASFTPDPNWDSQAGQAVIRSQEAERPGDIDAGDRGTALDPAVNTADLLTELDLYADQQNITRAEITAKWRNANGGIPVGLLDDLEPHQLLPLVEAIRTHLAGGKS